MNKKLKRKLTVIVSVVLVLAMLGGSCVYSAEQGSCESFIGTDEEYVDNIGSFAYYGHGQYKILNTNKSDILENEDALYRTDKDYTVAGVTGDGTVFQLSEDKYLIQAEDDIYLLADKLTVDHLNYMDWFESHKAYDIPSNIIDRVSKDIESHNGVFEDNYQVEIYLPSIIENGGKGQIDPNQDPASGDTSVSSYTFEGYTMKTIVTHITGDRDLINNSTTAYDVGISIISLAIAMSGCAGFGVTLWGIGTTAYGLYQALIGCTGANNTNSFLRVYLSHSTYYKATYVLEYGSWTEYVETTKVVIGEINSTERYGDSLEYLNRSQAIYQTMLTQNYNSPSYKALEQIPYNCIWYDPSLIFQATYTGAYGNSVTSTQYF